VRVAVAGGTGHIGSLVVGGLRATGPEPVVLARSRGIDLLAGTGLDDALAGVEAVVDVTNSTAMDRDATREFFGTVTRNLRAAEEKAGVGHHVLLSIVGIDRVEGNAHYAGKRLQEEEARHGPVPTTILRATQFFDFAEMVAGWTRDGDSASIAPLRTPPVADTDVAAVLVELATGDPVGGTIELAGPEPQDLVDMARRTLAARGETLRLVPTWQGVFGPEMAGDVLLPGPDARIAPTTFDDWLAALG
jgi:uncharacterized protein YbjT (DUF2867 family)